MKAEKIGNQKTKSKILNKGIREGGSEVGSQPWAGDKGAD